MWWLSGDVVAQRGCGGSEGMWWLSWGCGGSVGDVVAQWLSPPPDCHAAVPSSNPASLTEKFDCVLENKPQGGRRPCLSKKKIIIPEKLAHLGYTRPTLRFK
jgi:hypothetical protein